MNALAIIDIPEDPPLGLDVPKGQTFEEWVDLGKRLCAGSKVVNWWIGDWWAAGSHRYGERAKAAAEGIFGREFGGLMNLASVCRSFETSRRREALTFTHHAEVAALAPKDADRLLDQAEAQGWSTRDLREAVACFRDRPTMPRWMPHRKPNEEYSRPDAIEAIYQRLSDAASRGETCPTADELMEVARSNSVSTTVALMHVLEEEGRIEVDRFQRGRVVKIVATGEATATPPDTTPHWRSQPRDIPSPTMTAVSSANPTVASLIFAAARKKGKSPQDYLLDLVWLGWEVECARDDSLRRAESARHAA